jgi:hypothetical protein
MKTRGLIFIFVLFAQVASFAQTASIKIFTNSDDAKFRAYFQGELQNNFPVKEISFDSLSHKDMYKIVISFTADSIADINEEIYLLKGEHKVFEIKKKNEIREKSAKFGRKVGKLLKVGKYDKEDVLWDVYYLDDITESEYLEN